MNSLLSIQNLLVRRGGVTVLDIPELKVEDGRILALIGPNGAGKSTLLLTLAGLLKPSQGKLFYKGQPIETNADRFDMRRSVSVVFQEPLLLNTSVEKNVALGLNFRHCSAAEIKSGVEESLDYFGIRGLAARSAKTLSGGEAKRVSLARAFALKPKVILLDEAFNSLDPPTRETLMDDLRNILETTKISAVMALHDREETLRLAQDAAVMVAGQIVQAGAVSEVFNKPNSQFVASFVGTETILEGEVKSAHSGMLEIGVNGTMLKATGHFVPGQKVFCCLRPENIIVSNVLPENTSARNVLEAKITGSSRQAFFYKLHLDCGFPLVAYVTVSSCEELGLCEESIVKVSFKATSVHVLKR
ncbi:MAG: ABC transporter ATP-binding protein [Syntrophaceae bacterium]|jgi:tungstate transport system ATP-binding protein|nr:ABC transporter ATP-binding protein [Syntrophaceae bacterium]